MDDIKQRRIQLLAQIDKLNRERCPKCEGINYPTQSRCCDVNEQIKALGKELDKLVKPRKENDNLHDWTEYHYWEQVAIDNGISRGMFRQRVIHNAMPYERAAVLPESVKKEQSLMPHERELIKRLGINPTTIHNRIARGMTFEDAITKPIGHSRRKKKI